MTIDFRLIFG